MEQTMTSATSAASSKPSRRRPNGFTLIELLVVIGILALLVGILTPMVMRSWRNSKRARVSADFQAIASALEAYRSDFGDYPRVATAPGVNNAADRPNPPTGAQILCQALIAPAPATESSPPANQRAKQDGADGPGFKLRSAAGQTYGPYLEPTKFKIGDPEDPLASPPNPLKAVLLDIYNSPILYYPTNPGKPDPHVDYVNTSESALVDANDNLAQMGSNSLVVFKHTTGDSDTDAVNRLQSMLGDLSHNGKIDAAESDVNVGPYILWSCGQDEVFGTAAVSPVTQSDVNDCDDITNFKQ